MVLYSVNLARTAFTKLALLPSFFDEYDTGSDKPRHFKVLLKTMSNIFKAKNGHVDLIEKCILRLLEGGVNDLDLHGDRLVVELHCKFGVRKIYQLHYQATEPLKASFSKQVCTNTFSASPKIIQDWLTYFSHKLDEVSIGCTTTTADAIGNGLNDRRVIIKSFSEDVFGPGGGAGGAMSNTQGEADPAKRSLSTEISVDFEDFDSFEVFGDVEVTFSLKDLKTALGFADGIGQAIEAHFIGPGQPIIFSTCQPNIFSADFVLATNTFSSGATPTPPPQQQQRHPQNKRSQQEQQQQQHGSSTTNYSQDQEKQHQNPDQPPPLSSTRRTSRQSYASSSSSTTTPNNHHHDSPNLSYHSAAASGDDGRGPTLKKYGGDPVGAVGAVGAKSVRQSNPGSWNHDGGRRRRRQRQQEDDNDDDDDGMPLFSQGRPTAGAAAAD
ncbi:Rad9-domain-containing protein [Obelidium mucronatum]|nr:Rad9-domain-containing protein [Obelidium mucronatum]